MSLFLGNNLYFLIHHASNHLKKPVSDFKFRISSQYIDFIEIRISLFLTYDLFFLMNLEPKSELSDCSFLLIFALKNKKIIILTHRKILCYTVLLDHSLIIGEREKHLKHKRMSFVFTFVFVRLSPDYRSDCLT